MSFFSFLGKVGKTVLKVAAPVASIAAGLIPGGSGVSNMLGKIGSTATTINNATSGAPVAAPANLENVAPVAQQPLDLNKFITLPTVNIEHGVELPKASSLPSWLLPAGAGVLVLMLLGGRRR